MAFGVGVGIGNGAGVIDGGVAYGLGQIDPITPAEVNGIGGFARLTTPIWLLYRMLLGSALASIGAGASAVTVQRVAVPELSTLGDVAPGFIPYRLKLVARFKFVEIQVLLVASGPTPCKKEYGYHCRLGD